MSPEIFEKANPKQEIIPEAKPARKLSPGVVLFLITCLGLIVSEVLILISIHKSSPLPLPDLSGGKAILSVRFDNPKALEGWKEHIFHQKTKFEIKPASEGEIALRSASQNASSAIYQDVDVAPDQKPILSWEWKIVKFPSNKQNKIFGAKSDNDFGARVYVIFGNRKNPLFSNVIQYVWDDYFPEGTSAKSPSSGRVRLLVLRKGNQLPTGGWYAEKRDLVQDYEKLFGKIPNQNLKVVSLMSDSDNTKTESEAFFRSISLKSSQDEVALAAKSGEQGWVNFNFFSDVGHFFKRISGTRLLKHNKNSSAS
jgi:hypothetical protein